MWDRTYRASCACGKGYVEYHEYSEMNDWNQSREGTYGDRIECDACRSKYHIETRSWSYYKHRGDYGTVEIKYLVPIGESINMKPEISLPSLSFEEEIVASYTQKELSDALTDMKDSKYSTRVKNEVSKDIITRYERRHKKRSLYPIVELLEKLVNKYGTFTWTNDKYVAQKISVQAENDRINKLNEEVEKRSFRLEFLEV